MRKPIVLVLLLLAPVLLHADRKKAVEKFNDAQKQLSRKNLPKAEKLLQESIQLDSSFIAPHQLLGDIQYGTRRYNAAADEYTTALKLNDTEQVLKPEQLHVITNNLGVAIALAGNMEKAKQTFEDAIRQDPDYPIYHYNLACTYAELGELDPAMRELQLAWKLRNNLGEGEQFPDPRKDSSFKNYLNDPKFQETVQNMVF
ncbi:MAG TPA: tetratricopeptide repeat protein [Terriglobales bacterium]|nr:tetratricopeptide repeat protein [Terriglobales bacterium]